MFLAIKTEDGVIKGKISFYCRMLKVTRQGFYKYLANKDRPWKYQDLADAMRMIVSEDECNDTYGRIRMYQDLLLRQPEGIRIPSERTAYRVMEGRENAKQYLKDNPTECKKIVVKLRKASKIA